MEVLVLFTGKFLQMKTHPPSLSYKSWISPSSRSQVCTEYELAWGSHKLFHPVVPMQACHLNDEISFIGKIIINVDMHILQYSHFELVWLFLQVVCVYYLFETKFLQLNGSHSSRQNSVRHSYITLCNPPHYRHAIVTLSLSLTV